MDGEELTEQETALYDRQIRVWGANAQRRLLPLFRLLLLNTQSSFSVFKVCSFHPLYDRRLAVMLLVLVRLGCSEMRQYHSINFKVCSFQPV